MYFTLNDDKSVATILTEDRVLSDWDMYNALRRYHPEYRVQAFEAHRFRGVVTATHVGLKKMYVHSVILIPVPLKSPAAEHRIYDETAFSTWPILHNTEKSEVETLVRDLIVLLPGLEDAARRDYRKVESEGLRPPFQSKDDRIIEKIREFADAERALRKEENHEKTRSEWRKIVADSKFALDNLNPVCQTEKS